MQYLNHPDLLIKLLAQLAQGMGTSLYIFFFTLLFSLPLGLAVALLSSAIPYALDMVALPHIPARLFGILMSGQPAFAALSGLLILGEKLSYGQVAGMSAIIIASIGATATIARPAAAPSS